MYVCMYVCIYMYIIYIYRYICVCVQVGCGIPGKKHRPTTLLKQRGFKLNKPWVKQNKQRESGFAIKCLPGLEPLGEA